MKCSLKKGSSGAKKKTREKKREAKEVTACLFKVALNCCAARTLWTVRGKLSYTKHKLQEMIVKDKKKKKTKS